MAPIRINSAGGHVYDWIGTVFIEGATVERTLRMLQDYDHRSQYFPEVIASSKLLCRTGNHQFRFTMRMKEPSVVDVESEVLWQKVDPHRWRCRSYSIEIKNVGKDQKYIQRLFTYWRLAETDKGVYVEGESITLSGEFGVPHAQPGIHDGNQPGKIAEENADGHAGEHAQTGPGVRPAAYRSAGMR